jgi:hypothetical protein
MHDGTHGEGCFGCKVKTITVNPYSMPTRLHPGNAPKRPEPRWERGVPTDNRGMPFLDKNLNPMGVKAVAENRHSIEQHRRQLHNSSSPKE